MSLINVLSWPLIHANGLSRGHQLLCHHTKMKSHLLILSYKPSVQWSDPSLTKAPVRMQTSK